MQNTSRATSLFFLSFRDARELVGIRVTSWGIHGGEPGGQQRVRLVVVEEEDESRLEEGEEGDELVDEEEDIHPEELGADRHELHHDELAELGRHHESDPEREPLTNRWRDEEDGDGEDRKGGRREDEDVEVKEGGVAPNRDFVQDDGPRVVAAADISQVAHDSRQGKQVPLRERGARASLHQGGGGVDIVLHEVALVSAVQQADALPLSVEHPPAHVDRTSQLVVEREAREPVKLAEHVHHARP
mmetsp:Transcript_16775/g.49716  ORF Transcript_16775/g.49716 Transcript_16775/m.49716 type:complete len:245 (+) Transcript_16775:129-863(+)